MSGFILNPYIYAAVSGLYSFTTHTFTNAGVTGYDGPTLAQVQSAYSSQSWAQNTSYLNVVDQGIQQWKVPKTGTYRITAAGAQGGYHSGLSIRGGYGAILRLDVQLTQGTVLNIVVGQSGVTLANSAEGTGGGGGTFVYEGTIGGSKLILAAGGGGGTDDSASFYTQPNGESTGGSSAKSSLNPTLEYTGATEYTNNGQDGYYNGGSNAYGPGAGWLNDLYSRVGDSIYLTSGKSKTTPYWQGGIGPSYSGGAYGGFGGGGANYDDGGAGGGFTGGSTTSTVGGGAGGSYYAGMTNAYYTSDYGSVASNYSWLGVNGNTGTTGSHGYVTITAL